MTYTDGSYGLSRRTVVKAAAWSLPVVAIGSKAQAQSLSPVLTLTGGACKTPGYSQPWPKGYAFAAAVTNPSACEVKIFLESFTLNNVPLGTVTIVKLPPPDGQCTKIGTPGVFDVAAGDQFTAALVTSGSGSSANGTLRLKYRVSGSCLPTQEITLTEVVDDSPPIQGGCRAFSDAQQACIASISTGT